MTDSWRTTASLRAASRVLLGQRQQIGESVIFSLPIGQGRLQIRHIARRGEQIVLGLFELLFRMHRRSGLLLGGVSLLLGFLVRHLPEQNDAAQRSSI